MVVLLFIEMEKTEEKQLLRKIKTSLFRKMELSTEIAILVETWSRQLNVHRGLCGSQGRRNVSETCTFLSGSLFCFNILQINLYELDGKSSGQLQHIILIYHRNIYDEKTDVTNTKKSIFFYISVSVLRVC